MVEPDEIMDQLPHIGFEFSLNDEFDQEIWYGRGPMENYPDRKTAADYGIWRRRKWEGTTYYEKPQALGNREETRWICLTDDKGDQKFRITGKEQFSHSFLPFTQQQLAQKAHCDELKEEKEKLRRYKISASSHLSHYKQHEKDEKQFSEYLKLL